MSFPDNPPKSYTRWTPNEEFIQFFKQLKSTRSLPGSSQGSGGGDSETVKVTNTPVKSPLGLNPFSKSAMMNKGGTKKSTAKPTPKSGVSCDLVKSANDLLQYKKAGKVGKSNKRSKASKRSMTIEKKLRQAKF